MGLEATQGQNAWPKKHIVTVFRNEFYNVSTARRYKLGHFSIRGLVLYERPF